MNNENEEKSTALDEIPAVSDVQEVVKEAEQFAAEGIEAPVGAEQIHSEGVAFDEAGQAVGERVAASCEAELLTNERTVVPGEWGQMPGESGAVHSGKNFIPDERYDFSPPADAGRYSPYHSPPRAAGFSTQNELPGAGYGYPVRNDYERGYGYPQPESAAYPGRKRGFRTWGIVITAVFLITALVLILMEPAPRTRTPDFSFPTFFPTETRSPRETDFRPSRETPNIFATPNPETPGDSPDVLGKGIVLNLTSRQGTPEMSLQDLYKKCSPWVVAIEATVDEQSYNWGTGIIMTEDGYVVTNNHIIEGTSSILITTHDDAVYDAVLVGTDARSDLAVLKIDAQGLPSAVFGDSSELEVGDDVVAIGNPLGKEFRSTLTDGIVSAIDRSVVIERYSMTLIQTNAAINEGNSGGPLINLYGQVVGITNMKMISYYQGIEGIGFAIPSRQMKNVVDQLIENGYALGAPMLGIEVGPTPEDIDAVGVYVATVNKGADVYKKGLRPGDLITAVNGEPVATVGDVNAAKADYGIGDEITLTIYRGGRIFDMDIILVDSNELE